MFCRLSLAIALCIDLYVSDGLRSPGSALLQREGARRGQAESFEESGAAVQWRTASRIGFLVPLAAIREEHVGESLPHPASPRPRRGARSAPPLPLDTGGHFSKATFAPKELRYKVSDVETGAQRATAGLEDARLSLGGGHLTEATFLPKELRYKVNDVESGVPAATDGLHSAGLPSVGAQFGDADFWPNELREKLSEPALIAKLDRGSVFKCVHADSGLVVAVKAVEMRSAAHRVSFQREVFYSRLFGHGDCIEFLGSADVMLNATSGYGFIFMQYADGTLDAELPRQFGEVSGETRFRLAFEIVRALHTLQADGCLHRDVKPANIGILGNCSTPDGCHAKLLDFGLACTLEEQANGRDSDRGTLAYWAPEVWEFGIHLPKSDVWSAGLVVAKLLTGIQRHKGGDIREDASFRAFSDNDPDVADLVAAMLAADEASRPSFGEVLEGLQRVARDRGVEVRQPEPGPAVQLARDDLSRIVFPQNTWQSATVDVAMEVAAAEKPLQATPGLGRDWRSSPR